MNRILIANGTFSLLVLGSILKSINSKEDNNFLLGYFKNSSLAKSQKLYDFFNILIDTKKNFNFFDYKKISHYNFQKLNQNMQTQDINEIYIPINSSTKYIYTLFKKEYKDAEFFFYEEGLMSYIKPLFDKTLRKIMTQYNNYYLFYDDRLKDLLETRFKKIKFHKIKKEDMLENIKKLQTTLPPFKELEKDSKYALVLPQYYHQNNKAKTKEILYMYKKHIEDLIKNGYKIIFKDHPKAKLKYSTQLELLFSKDDFILFESLSSKNLEIYPVEVIGNILKIDLVFSVYSTSLFTFKYLFDIPTYTSRQMLNERMNGISIYPTFSALITENIINNLFDNRKNTNNILYTKNKLLKILILMLKFYHKYSK